ncbi:AAA family ATPase [Bryobacter aggregatus]|uniref:AAA family ATPase n=1 Tax=Bryobacter aggregatus TaxID=360054 RepID=UPI0012BABDBF|nr:AAA family ATPase [Bryobacter aggregatus]
MTSSPMFLKILAHPVFVNLNFHMPMVVDLSHPLVMLAGDNGAGKSTLLHSIYYALRNESVDGYIYRLDTGVNKLGTPYMFDAEQHNPRMQLDLFQDNPQMIEFLQMASHGQVMLAMFRENFPSLPDGTILLLDEPEMALSTSNQRRILKMLMELVDQKNFRIICATHSPILLDSKDTYVINLDEHKNKNVADGTMGVQGATTLM